MSTSAIVPHLTDNDKALVEALAAAIGGVATTIMFYPLDTAKTRYQAQAGAKSCEDDSGSTKKAQTSVTKVLIDMARNEGMVALYRGVGFKCVHSISQTFLYFYTYSFLKRQYESRVGRLSTTANLLIGMAAGAYNVMWTQPLDTMSTRLQIQRGGSKAVQEPQGKTSKPVDERAKELALVVLTNYRGLGASLLLCCNPAIQYTAFEQMRRRALGVTGDEADAVALSALGAFMLGALSKSFSTIVTYPLIRSKVMVQTMEKGGSDTSTPSMMQAAQQIVKSGGYPGFFVGLQAQLFKTVTASAAMLAIKEKSFASALALMTSYRLRFPHTTAEKMPMRLAMGRQ